MTTTSRIHYMDNLRALAMLAGVVFHAALAYSPLIRPYWPPADAAGSAAVDMAAWWLHAFRMPLFFVVAGFFSALLVQRRGLAGLFRTRLVRVLLPLLAGVPLVVLGMYRLTVYAATTVQHPSPVLAWLRDYAATQGSVPLMPSLAHLWFLAYLMLFTLLVWVVAAIEPQRAYARIRALPVSWPTVLVAPLLLAPALAMTTNPWPAPEALLPQLWAVAYFGAYFALGYHLYLQPALIDGLRRFGPLLLVGALVAYAASPWVLGTPRPVPAGWATRGLDAVLQACAGLWMTLCCLIAGRAWLDTSNRVMRWFADAAYWVYLVHLPVLFAIQYRLLDVALPWPAKFALATTLTLAVSLASYQLLVRHTVLGRWLNGRRPPRVTHETYADRHAPE